jgi:hypothetical protein
MVEGAREELLEPGPEPRTAAGSLSIASERADRRWRGPLVYGMLLAAVFHLAVLLMFRTMVIPESPFSAAGPPRGDYRPAAGGGSGMTMVEVTPAPEEVPVTEAIVPEIVVPEPAPPEEPVDEPAPEVTPSLPGQGDPGEGGEEGSEAGPGRDTGTGEGGGGTEDEGASGIVAPTPRAMFLPPADRPRSVRGRELTVWVFVDPRGRVVSDSTRLDPPTPDSRYNSRLRQSAAQWRFDPARSAGIAVAAWYPYEIIL